MRIVPTNNGEVFLEDEKSVSEGQREALRKNVKKATAWLADHKGVNHYIYSSEDGVLVSRMTLKLEEPKDLMGARKELLVAHNDFIRLLDKWLIDKIEEIETPVERLQKKEDIDGGHAEDTSEAEPETFLNHPMLLIEMEEGGFSVQGNIPIRVAIGLLMKVYAEGI